MLPNLSKISIFNLTPYFKKSEPNILKVFLSKFKYKNESQFINDFEILSVLRNLKIIGIFTRLAKRDKKRKYLKLIPYAWKLIDNRIKNNPNFHDLKNFLQKNPRIKKI